MEFLGKNYLLGNRAAEELFNDICDMPILDAHNHANLPEIAENKNYSDIWQVEAATDHYVWELMRKRGVDEEYITGKRTNKEKWLKLAEVFPDFVGNPTYEWIHLDLKRMFGIEDLISAETAESIWTKTLELLAKPEFKPRALLKKMKVETMCSTDDPIDSLEFHKKINSEEGKLWIRPTWRPDKSMNIQNKGWKEYIVQIGQVTGIQINGIDDLIVALKKTHKYFVEQGCKATDHGIETPFGYNVSKDRADEIFKKVMGGSPPSREEIRDYISFMMHEYGKMNAEAGLVMQIHIGAVRNVRDSLYNRLGPDVGGDISNHLIEIVEPLRTFLNYFDELNESTSPQYRGLKILLYCLDPTHYPTLATLTRAFGKNVNLGAAWWFNDSPIGMKRQLEYIGSVDLLSNYAGMVSDSRKLLSYASRNEMFRRVLADILGSMVERGQIPLNLAKKLAKNMCYENPKKIFSFPIYKMYSKFGKL